MLSYKCPDCGKIMICEDGGNDWLGFVCECGNHEVIELSLLNNDIKNNKLSKNITVI